LGATHFLTNHTLSFTSANAYLRRPKADPVDRGKRFKMAPPDLSFLTKDIERQQEIAKQALEEARRVESLLQGSDVPADLKLHLEKTRDKLLVVAQELAANATSTSTAATVTIVGASVR